MAKSTDPEMLAAVNELGETATQLFDGFPVLVVLNVTAALFVGAVKAAKLSRENAHDALDLHWEDGGGMTAQVVRPS